MKISRAVLSQILSSRSPHVRRDGGTASFTLLCTVEEGIGCRFGSGQWNDRTLLPVCARLVAGLGWKRLEYASGRQAVIRCVAPYGDEARAVCQVDLGDGWEPLPVEA